MKCSGVQLQTLVMEWQHIVATIWKYMPIEWVWQKVNCVTPPSNEKRVNIYFCLKNVCLWFKFSCFKKGEGLDHFDTQETGWYSDLTRGRAFACGWGFPSVRAKEPVFLVHALSLYRVSLTWYYHWVIFCQPFMTKVDQVSFTEHCCHIHTLGSSIDWAKTEWPD